MSSSIDVLRGELLHLAQPGADHVCVLLPALCPDLFGTRLEGRGAAAQIERGSSAK